MKKENDTPCSATRGKLPTCRKMRGFTLVELLVVIAIIGILTSLGFGALQKTREAARFDKTKAIIAKLDDIITRRYESYAERRIPLDFNGISPKNAAGARMLALRDLVRMEMPDRWIDITTGPQSLMPYYSGTLPTYIQQSGYPALGSSLQQLYYARIKKLSNANPPADHEQAKCLYMVVMMGSPEARSEFTSDEIAMNLDGDGYPMFIDGWGHPIGWLRWAPGFTPYSDIQIDDTNTTTTPPGLDYHHDPFDPRKIQTATSFDSKGNPLVPAYHLIPLIFAGVIGKDASNHDDYGITLNFQTSVSPTPPTPNPYTSPYVSTTGTQSIGAVVTATPLVHNHHMEQK